MTRTKPSRVRQPLTIVRYLARFDRYLPQLEQLGGCPKTRFARLIAELRRSLAPRTRRGEGR